LIIMSSEQHAEDRMGLDDHDIIETTGVTETIDSFDNFGLTNNYFVVFMLMVSNVLLLFNNALLSL